MANFDRAKLEAALASTPACECGSNDWSVVEGFVMVTVSPVSTEVNLGNNFPAVAVGCNKCGLLKTYVASMLGLA